MPMCQAFVPGFIQQVLHPSNRDADFVDETLKAATYALGYSLLFVFEFGQPMVKGG